MSQETVTAPTPPATPPPGVGAPASTPPPPHRRSGSATAGIALIVIGIVFLLGRLVPGIGWWNLWPLIIVIAGLVQAFTPGKEGWSLARMFDGFTTVAIGGVFLAIVFGIAGWGVWGTIFSLWPVLVIAIGLDLLGKALGTSWFKVLGSIVVIAALAYAVSVSASGGTGIVWFSGDLESAEITEPVRGISEASLLIQSGVSEVELEGGSQLVAASGQTPFGEPEFSVDRDSERADVRLLLGSGGGMGMYPGSPTARMNASISKAVLWDITVETGVSRFRADLRGVPVRSLRLEPGIAECEVRLGDAPEGEAATVDVQTGIASVKILVPEGADVRVEHERGLSGFDIASEFKSVGNDVWETSGYARADKAGDPVWIINVHSGIGAVNVDTY